MSLNYNYSKLLVAHEISQHFQSSSAFLQIWSEIERNDVVFDENAQKNGSEENLLEGNRLKRVQEDEEDSSRRRWEKQQMTERPAGLTGITNGVLILEEIYKKKLKQRAQHPPSAGPIRK